jgi:transposase
VELGLRQFRRWTLAGVWDVMLAALNDSGAGQDSLQMIDFTIVRAHQHAAGAQKSVRP